jgi:hypothetical protein
MRICASGVRISCATPATAARRVRTASAAPSGTASAGTGCARAQPRPKSTAPDGRAAGYVELGEHLLRVVAGGEVADRELLCDLRVAEALAEQPRDGDLAGGQAEALVQLVVGERGRAAAAPFAGAAGARGARRSRAEMRASSSMMLKGLVT